MYFRSLFILDVVFPNYSTFDNPGRRVFFLQSTRVVEYFFLKSQFIAIKNM